MSQDSLHLYLNVIGRVPMLTAAEEIHLGTVVQEWLNHPGGPDAAPRSLQRRGRRAKDRMITANLRLVVNVARRHGAKDTDLADHVQEGTIGLIRGVEKFDPTRGYKFSTYAYWWIRQAISRRRADGLIRLPPNVMEAAITLRRITGELQRQGIAAPTFEQVAERCSKPVAHLRAAAEAIALQQVARLDAAVGDGEGSSLGELIAAQGLSPWEQLERLELEPVVARLQAVAGDDLALLDLAGQGHLPGEVMGTSGARGQQLLREARIKLRALAGAEARDMLRAG